MPDLFPLYPASSAAVRAAARSGHGAAEAFGRVSESVEARHRAAAAEATDDLRATLDGPSYGPLTTDANALQRGAIWAASQVEVFADAIDIYNESSKAPRSIRKLNAAYAEATGTKPEDPALKGQLTMEKEQLDRALDQAAEQVAAKLSRPPTDAEVRELWRAGNLPMAAIAAWPGLNLRLTDLPFEIRDTAVTAEGLRYLTDQHLVDALLNPNLNPEVRQLILENRPTAVELLAQQWQLTPETKARLDFLCVPNSDGQIVGPDGRLYYVQRPGPGPAYDGPVIGAPNDFIGDDGPGSTWRTLISRDGAIAYGDPMDLATTMAFVLAGDIGKPSGKWQSIGDQQGAYVTMEDGSVRLNDGTQAPNDQAPPPGGPVPEGMKPPNPYNGGDIANGGLGLLIDGAEGLNNAQQAEFNRHYATEVTFQEDADGNRRAVINLYQVQADGEKVRIDHSYADIGPGGTIVPAP
ncbi:hypothetical protein MU582_00300 [Nocardioidaceae bacterium SCSIO 66511]|nr:hypothetical protein MU582_00300 [Nocardioidaceae bacterium SCSIO 66511]